MAKIPIAFDSILLNHANKRRYVEWDTDLQPNLGIIGDSGTGKSYLIRLLLGYIYRYAGDNPKAYIAF